MRYSDKAREGCLEMEAGEDYWRRGVRDCMAREGRGRRSAESGQMYKSVSGPVARDESLARTASVDQISKCKCFYSYMYYVG